MPTTPMDFRVRLILFSTVKLQANTNKAGVVLQVMFLQQTPEITKDWQRYKERQSKPDAISSGM